ncbi:MAG TPA: DUF1697 domain-containing protein [Tetragenococcus sp.]|nr:DUF1697 domain-containing protein [Tetragenococcus sp.]
MQRYVVYLRGINVGGKNKIKMANLRACLTEAGFEQVKTYIQSGNIVLRSALSVTATAERIEKMMVENLELDSERIKVVVLDIQLYQTIMKEVPQEFDLISEIDYRYDILFLRGVSAAEVMKEVEARVGIDQVWQGKEAIYYRRPGPKNPDYTKSALSRIVRKPIYQSITMRNWNTAKKMYELLTKDE